MSALHASRHRNRSQTPLQVTLKVKIAEVSRSLVRQIGVNLLRATALAGSALALPKGQHPARAGGRRKARHLTRTRSAQPRRGGKLFGLSSSQRWSSPKVMGWSPPWPSQASPLCPAKRQASLPAGISDPDCPGSRRHLGRV
jgi:hypothetical protein